jgi:RNA polymerase sigma factor (sigma-70 family)
VALKKSKQAGLKVWTVAQLSAFYTENRQELLTHANRVLKDLSKAEEVTQDALIKFMLAAPELESESHAISYLHRTIENLCIDLFRAEGRRPNLVLLDDAQSEVDAAWQMNGDHSAAISAAEDAAIIRQALSLLSPAERAALVMWEVEGRSTKEIAAELGIKESTVRHTVSRARLSLRRVLTEVILDQKRGLTAMDMLSTSYKKAAIVAKKSSKAALSLMIVLSAFLGFNSLTGNESNTASLTSIVTTPVTPELPESPAASELATTEENSNIDQVDTEFANGVNALGVTLSSTLRQIAYARVTNTAAYQDVSDFNVARATSYGSANGVNGQQELVGLVNQSPNSSVFSITRNDSSIFIEQETLLVDGNIQLSLYPFILAGSTLITPEVLSISTSQTRLSDGNYRLVAQVIINPAASIVELPSQIDVELLVSPDGSNVISESARLFFTTKNKEVI